MASRADIQVAIDAFANELDIDVVVYFGDITAAESRWLVTECHKRRLRKNVLLILSTYGGDPNAAYRIGRTLQEAYNTVPRQHDPKAKAGATSVQKPMGEFWICIDGVCKSAGTIICLGASHLIMSEHAELGPIDIQLRKQDEIGERTSGLTPIQAVNFLENQSVVLFKRHFKELRESDDLGFSSKMASDIATRLSVGLLEPIYQQIDPIRLAEVDRSLQISKEYGDRLKTDNVKEGAINKLIAGYPSHGFVIDRKEARDLFAKVEDLGAPLDEILQFFRAVADWVLGRDDTFVVYVCREPPEPPTAEAPPAAETPPKPETENG
jgi:hypothetical protein